MPVLMVAAWITLAALSVGAVAALLAGAFVVRRRNMHYWLPQYVFPSEPKRPLPPEEPIDVFIAVGDHYEPECQHVSHERARERVARWVDEYPQLFERYRDSSGRPPQHTFFFPQDEYRPEYLDELKRLCDAGFGDVDVHLHHDGDTADQLREKLDSFRETLFHRHGLLRKDPRTGEIVYGFIHGNWALCNSRPDRRWCGVDQELTVLLETGCYADFTLPSAPSACQTTTINSIYYAKDTPGECKSHDTGLRARVGQAAPADQLLMIQGPLGLDWRSRKLGVVPRIENADIHEGRAPTWRRMRMWLDADVHVAGQPNWKFVKLHTHGCKDGNIDTWLGPEMQQFHEELAAAARTNPRFRYHYVTAWEMAQLVHQAESSLPLPGDWSELRGIAPTAADRTAIEVTSIPFPRSATASVSSR